MKRTPVTRFLVLINSGIHISLFAWAISHPAFSMQSFYDQWGLVPADFWSGAAYQPITSMFLHGSWLHLVVNMIALWSLGTAIELTVGPVRFGLLYLFSGLFGALGVVVFQSHLAYPTVGASGAIMGILAAIAIFYPKSEMLIFFFPMKARTAAIAIGALSVLLALYDKTSGISHLGHLGGLIGGILYTKFVLRLEFLRNQLHSMPDSKFQFRRAQSAESRSESLEEELRQMVDQLRQERSQPNTASTDSASDDESKEPFNQLIREESNPPTEKKVYFDPTTGRFYVK